MAASLEPLDPARLGFDPQRLERAVEALEADIEAGRCDGGTLLVSRREGLALRACRGFADRAAGRRLEPDDVFFSMSIGKQFVNALVLERVERGLLRLHEPIAERLPAFRGHGKSRITLFHLLTHTSGLLTRVPELEPEELIDVERFTAAAAAAPLESLPGERVSYSILAAHAVLASLLIEADGGRRSVGEMLREDLFELVGMRDTSLGPRDDLLARLCPVVARYEEPGLFDPAALESLAELVVRPGAELTGGGYLTTASDVHRFAEALRGGGALAGRRLLSPAMLELARRNHTGECRNTLMDYTVSLRGWDPWPACIGLGFFVRGTAITPGPIGNLASPTTFGGWGAGSTAFWIDPERDLSFTFLSTGLMEDSRHIERVAHLHDLVLAALVD
ncbi:MAG: serine hydrolase domain-containing protein [Myxococcota bacterium]|nr:serine hydrolase domain-containing protein [Myxococcota bacterium]